MVVADDRTEARGSGQRCRDALADLDMSPHRFELVAAQRALLQEDRFGDADAPEVVEQDAVGHGMQIGGRKADPTTQLASVLADALGVLLDVRVPRVHLARERGDDLMCGLHAEHRSACAQGSLDARDEDLGVDGLGDQVVSALTERRRGSTVEVRAAQDQDRQVRVAAVAMDAPHEWLTALIGDPEIEEHDVDGMALERVEHRLAIGDDDRVVARLLEDRGDDARAHDVPVRHEDARTAQVEDRCGLPDARWIRLADEALILALGCRSTVHGAEVTGHAGKETGGLGWQRRSVPRAHGHHHAWNGREGP